MGAVVGSDGQEQYFLTGSLIKTSSLRVKKVSNDHVWDT